MPAAKYQRGDVGKDEPDIGEYRVFGMRVARWVEHPFEWIRPRHFMVVRDYLGGPLRRFRGGAELQPDGSGTIIRVFAEFEPRTPLAAPLVKRVLLPQSLNKSCRQYQAIADFLDRKNAQPFPRLVEQRTPANLTRLNELLGRVQAAGVPATAIDLLRHQLTEAPDEDVSGMRPLALARQFGTDPDETLAAFLQATVAGLLEMRWEMLCPGCRGVKADAAHLNELAAAGHCDACNLDFEPDADELIEARFYPAPAVRDVEVGTYCVGSPVKTPHRLLQAILEPGESRTVSLDVAEGSYILRSPQTRGLLRLQVQAEAPSSDLQAQLQSASIEPAEFSLRPGRESLTVANVTSRRLTLTLDQGHTPQGAATPGRLMLLPAFQSLFSGEALGPGIQLQIGRVALLFTDLAGSTALYQQVGDARAFRLVSDHFGILRRAIEESKGALIKTIGDAIMAAFPDSSSAVAAGLRIQRYIVNIDDRGVVRPNQWVKVGVHAGACFVVNQNDTLDYFGTTVNIAARAQHEARGGEIILTEAAFGEAAEVLASAPHSEEWFTVQLRGITEPMRLVRVTPEPPPVG